MFQSTARWQINSYMSINLILLILKSFVSIDGTLADQFLPKECAQTNSMGCTVCFNRRHAGRSILTQIMSFGILEKINAVSIDGTLADQFLQ